jgi:hypothetical protein
MTAGIACTVWLPSTVMAGSMTRVETAPRQHRLPRRLICGVQDLLPLLGADEVRALVGGSPPYGIRRHRSHAARGRKLGFFCEAPVARDQPRGRG